MSVFSNRQSKKFTLIVIDLILVWTAYFAAFHIRYDNIRARNWEAFMSLVPWILLITLLFVTIYELYSFEQKRNWDIARNVIVASTMMMFATMAASFLFREFALPRSVILISYFLINIFLLSWKLLFIRFNRIQHNTALFIGNEDEQKKMMGQIAAQLGERTSIQFVSSTEEFSKTLLSIQSVNDIIIGPSISSELKSNIIYHAIKNKKIVYVVPNLYDLLLSKSFITSIDDTMVMAVKPFGLSWGQELFKRIYDLMFSLIALIILSPILLIVAIVVKLEDPKGKILYKQKRWGKNNKEFTIYKFRSMIEGAESLSGPVLAGENDPRITKIGRFLRKTRIDEFPQFYNVLVGDMSIVGPRPERQFFIEQFEKSLNSYRYRNTVKPGITGYAQIKGKYTTSVEDKLRFDLFYIRNYSFTFDLMIQFRTVIVLLDKSKAEGNK